MTHSKQSKETKVTFCLRLQMTVFFWQEKSDWEVSKSYLCEPSFCNNHGVHWQNTGIPQLLMEKSCHNIKKYVETV